MPLIVAWPGIVKAGTIDATPVISTDWTPTLLAAVGERRPTASTASASSNCFTKGKAPPPRPLFWHQPHYTNQGGRPVGAIREGAWKLIEHYENGACELFHLAKDVGETIDLAAKEPGRVADLRGKLENWRRNVGAQEKSPNPKFNGASQDALPRRRCLDVPAD